MPLNASKGRRASKLIHRPICKVSSGGSFLGSRAGMFRHSNARTTLNRYCFTCNWKKIGLDTDGIEEGKGTGTYNIKTSVSGGIGHSIVAGRNRRKMHSSTNQRSKLTQNPCMNGVKSIKSGTNLGKK